MRFVAVVFAVAAVALGAWTGAASAAPVQGAVFHGIVAEAVWDTASSTRSTSTDITVARNLQGRALFLYQFTSVFDESGTYAGSTLITAGVRSGFSLSLNGSLATADVSGQNVPATSCSYDAAGDLLACTASAVDLQASWLGEGRITHSTSTAHFHEAGFTSAYHESGFLRGATATGLVNGLALPARSVVDAHLGKNTNGSVEICVRDGC